MAAPEFIGERPFYGWTVEELKTALRTAQGELAGYISRSSAGDTSVERTQTEGVRTRIRLLQRELHVLAPDKFPANVPLKRTTVAYL